MSGILSFNGDEETEAYISMKKLPKLSQLGKGRPEIRSQDLGVSSCPLHCSGQPVFTEHLRHASSSSQPYGKCGARSQWSIRIFKNESLNGNHMWWSPAKGLNVPTCLEKGNISVLVGFPGGISHEEHTC